MDWNITGHKRQLALLEKSLTSGKVAHGYLFAGPAGVGKKTIAYKFAAELLGIEVGKFSPDLIEIDGSAGIKIEQIRELSYNLALKPYSAAYKVAIVDAAEEMTVESANALLKVLEEPKDHTIIILITSNPNRLPKTIVSRTQKITFGLVEGREPQPDANDKHEILEAPDVVAKLLLAQELADLETHEVEAIFNSWLVRFEARLRQAPSVRLKNLIEQIMLSQKYLNANANSKLLLTNLMLNT